MKTLIDSIFNSNPIEIIGIVLSLIYLYFEIKAKVLMWFFGIVSSAIMGIVFFQSGFYADMGLMFYYVIISIYGWIHWHKGSNEKQLPIGRITKKQTLWALLLLGVGYIVLLQILLYIPGIIGLKDSTFPYVDALTVAASMVATWMLSQKILEQWHVWIVVNLVSSIMFAMKGLNYTTFLYLIYLIGSFWGYIDWMKSYRAQTNTLC